MAMERLLESTRDLATPALVVDAAAVDRNIARAAAYFAGRDTRLRPHFKAHKCTEMMRRHTC
jgi:D-serine deaminase-like pyridoxal phosphate-dependent protein